MMINIGNFYTYRDVRQYDLQSQKISPANEDGLCTYDVVIDGVFQEFNSNVVVFYRQNDLYLSVNGQNYLFTDLQIKTSDVQRAIEEGFIIKQIRHIIIRDHFDSIILSTDYNDIIDTFVDDWTPMIEDEDFDFGLFLENISHNTERQGRLFPWRRDLT